MTTEERRRNQSWRSLNVLVPTVGLLYFALLFSALTIQTLVSTGSIQFFELLYSPFVITSFLALIGLWRRSRLGYVAAAAVSVLVVVITGAAPKPNDLIDVLSNPASSGEFFSRITFYPALLAVLVYSVLGFRETSRRRLGADQMPSPKAIPRSSVVALLVLGFILGGLIIGILAGGTQTRLLAGSGSTGDITIVQGGGSPSNGQFYSPANFTVKAGTTVTWVNRDSTPHTVTSTNGAFDSGNMDGGAVYKFTFTSPGTYQYTCTYHAWMKGTITVTSG
jgi:plastocyanin